MKSFIKEKEILKVQIKILEIKKYVCQRWIIPFTGSSVELKPLRGVRILKYELIKLVEITQTKHKGGKS